MCENTKKSATLDSTLDPPKKIINLDFKYIHVYKQSTTSTTTYKKAVKLFQSMRKMLKILKLL